ncbi:MAG: T9SS type A sorting domain-containing protein [Bacteroidota bacterium]
MEISSRRSTVLFLLMSISLVPAFAQHVGYHDRLARVRDLINSQELVMIWGQGASSSTQSCYQRIYDLNLSVPSGVDSSLVREPEHIDSALAGNKGMAVAAGDFRGGAVKDFVAAWEGPGHTVSVAIPDVQAGTLSWSTVARLTIPGLAPFGISSKIHLVAGDFFGDHKDEIVLAYEGSDTTIHLQLFSFDGASLVPQPQGSINDEHAMPPSTYLDDWDIVAGDFDGDGFADLALLSIKPGAGSDWSFNVKLYTVDDQGQFVPKGSKELMQNPGYSISSVKVSGASGDFDTDAAQELAAGVSFRRSQSGPDTFVRLLDVQNGLNSIVPGDSVISGHQNGQLTVRAGDLNNDGRDEVVLSPGAGALSIYSVGPGLVPTLKAEVSATITFVNFNASSLAVGDMDADGRDEIVIADSYYDVTQSFPQSFDIRVYSLDSTLTQVTLKARRGGEEVIPSTNGSRNTAIAMGDFDGDREWLGEPVHYRKNNVMQPSVVLYSPPTHYDIFDTTVADLSGCFPGQSCGFSSSYVQSTTVDTTITTETHEDWGGDASVFVQTPAGSSRIDATYGNAFSRSQSSSSTFTITTGRIAAGDDWLYANVYDIDFYEYPVYNGVNPAPIGHFLVSIPGTPRPLWIESKDDDVLGNLFRPDHEVGNVLSYPEDAGRDTARVITNFPEQTVGGTGSSFVSLQSSTFQENHIQSSWDAGLEVGLTIGSIGSVGTGVSVGEGVSVEASVSFPVGVEVGVSGHYNAGQITTQTVSVGHSLQVESDLGHLSGQWGASGTYYVKPYAYWTSYGALALDYKVSPLPTGANSFWQTRYGGKPDLAFSLPWRYDPQKGLSLPNNDPTYVQRTRDIFLSSPFPQVGDTVGIYARVHNYGLAPVTTPFAVKIYKGDPSSGGTLLGQVVIDTTIAPRGWRAVLIPWAIPASEDLLTDRIYAVIDPDNAVSNEVHENNNIGWAPAVAYGGTFTSVHGAIQAPRQFTLYPAYPNPFNPMTTIRFDLPTASRISLQVFNVLGQRVVTLADEVLPAGSHQVHFDAAGYASGVYIYRIEASPVNGRGIREVAVRKLLLLK